MKRSSSKILTTHVGSLPFLSVDQGIALGDQSRLREEVAAIVARQREIGIDVINEGEYAKGGDWLRYMQNRFGGFTDIGAPEGKPLIEQGQGSRGIRRVLQIRHRARHAVLRAGRSDCEKAPGSRVHRPGRLYRSGRSQEGDRRHGRSRRHRGCVSDLDRAGEPRSLPAQSLLQERRGLCLRHRRSNARRI